MATKIIQLDSVASYIKYCGFEPVHPLVAVVDMSKAKRRYKNVRLNYGFCALWLKNGRGCIVKYGRRNYDYQSGTVVCYAPGQVVEVETSDDTAGGAIGLLFHPDLIHGTALGKKIGKYTFFSYYVSEALHLSGQEREQYLDILGNIKRLAEDGTGKQHKLALCHHIEILLDLCLGLYDRQFNTRKEAEGDILADFEKELQAYFDKDLALQIGFPTVSYLADRLHLSPGYFGTLIRRETGRTAQDYIQDRIINLAKGELLDSDLPINEIAFKLGFGYSQHFTRMFKRLTGLTPTQYRKLN